VHVIAVLVNLTKRVDDLGKLAHAVVAERGGRMVRVGHREAAGTDVAVSHVFLVVVAVLVDQSALGIVAKNMCVLSLKAMEARALSPGVPEP